MSSKTFRATIVRDGSMLEGRETIDVRLDLDTEKREITAPADLLRALRATRGATERWNKLSYSHQREYVEAIEEARKPETRARRIAGAVGMLKPAGK